MACRSCGDGDNADVRTICRVCELVDGNTSIQRVKYCNPCKAYVCASCWDNIPRRAIAFSKSLVQSLSDKFNL